MARRIASRLQDKTGVSVTVDLDQGAVRQRLAAFLAAGEDLSPAMAAIADYMVFASQQRFEAEAGPGGAKWPPFAAGSLKRMRKGRTTPKLLRDSGLLYASLDKASDATSALAGSNIVYARIHQLGGEIRIPEREGSARFRMAKEGAGSRKDKDGQVVRYGSKLRFAKRSSRAKSVTEKSFTVPEHQVRIPARPYLGFDATDELRIGEILVDHFGGAS